MQEQPSTPYGYCKCGCGQETKLAPRTVKCFGYVQGEPYDWVKGHAHMKRRPDYETDGHCLCGCGQLTEIATHTRAGLVAGFPKPYIRGHAQRGYLITERYGVQERGYETPCWVWLLCQNQDGYGITNLGAAHRLAYVEAKGPIPEGLEIDHLCNVRLCVNPDHLEAVTHAENVRRAAARTPRPVGPKCHGCGKFLRKDSMYTNVCGDCWGPEDEFLF